MLSTVRLRYVYWKFCVPGSWEWTITESGFHMLYLGADQPTIISKR
jgi:hypothetical protein